MTYIPPPWRPHLDFVPAPPYYRVAVAGPQVRIVPTLREVLLEMDKILASFLPDSLPGETVSNYIARLRAATSGLPVSVEKRRFHAQLSFKIAQTVSPLVGVSTTQIAQAVFAFLEE